MSEKEEINRAAKKVATDLRRMTKERRFTVILAFSLEEFNEERLKSEYVEGILRHHLGNAGVLTHGVRLSVKSYEDVES